MHESYAFRPHIFSLNFLYICRTWTVRTCSMIYMITVWSAWPYKLITNVLHDPLVPLVLPVWARKYRMESRRKFKIGGIILSWMYLTSLGRKVKGQGHMHWLNFRIDAESIAPCSVTSTLNRYCQLGRQNIGSVYSCEVGYWHQRADETHGNPTQGNQELLVVTDKVGRPPGELG